MFRNLLLNVSGFITEKLTDHPEVGIGGAAVTVAASPTQTLQLIGTILGIIIAVLTLAIKLIEIVAKIQKYRSGSNHDDQNHHEEI